MIQRGQNFKPMPLNLVGSSIFGRYAKISIEKTVNMFISDQWLVPYAGYQIAIPNLGKEGRGAYTSTKSGRIVAVFDNNVYLINLFFDQSLAKSFDTSAIKIGKLLTNTGVVYITENNKPQILISDNLALYIYDPTLSPAFQQVPNLAFVPGYVSFHDTYFLCAASQDNFYAPAATNTWRLSQQNDGMTWLNDSASIGLLQTKADKTQAITRFPSKGNLILILGEVVTEFWKDTGAQLFPYQRSAQISIDYGCLSPATVVEMDEMVVWLAANEKSGPIIMYTTGGMPEKITTDGIDYLFSQLTNPADSRAFIYRQDGHLIYHINFYTDNLSLFYDFNTKKFFHACDENLNYFIASQVAYFNNQYYFVSKNNGNLYAFDTIYTTYDGAEIPRIRTCKNIRLPSQEYFIVNDVGFTIESGETNWQQQSTGPINLITQDGKKLITEGKGSIYLKSQDDNFILFQNGNNFITQQSDPNDFDYLISEQNGILNSTPRVDFSISIDGGASFGNEWGYDLPPIGQRKNRLMWWQCGAANDLVCQFKFWGIGRFVCVDGTVNIRQ
jgi:hypothetical protein